MPVCVKVMRMILKSQKKRRIIAGYSQVNPDIKNAKNSR